MVNLEFLGIKCRHERVSINEDCAYCPDCGEYIEHRWYLARCSCCGVKRKAVAMGNGIISESDFCTNCGGLEIVIEELQSLNFIDISYAAVLKVSTKTPKINYTQVWINNTQNAGHALLGLLG